MKYAIFTFSALPLVLAVSCWWNCGCEWICPSAGAIACIALAVFASIALHVVASIAWELHLLSR